MHLHTLNSRRVDDAQPEYIEEQHFEPALLDGVMVLSHPGKISRTATDTPLHRRLRQQPVRRRSS